MESVEEPPVAKPSESVATAEKNSATVQVKVSKKLLVWSGILLALVVLGICTWKFKLYMPVYAHFESGTISLKVKEGDKFPIEGAKITFNDTIYTTDSNGKVTITGILRGDYNAHVVKDGYTPLDQKVTIKRGDNDLQLFALTKIPEKLYSINGIIQDEVSGKTLVDVQVALSGTSKQTNPNGEFSFTKIAPGDYKLILSKAGYLDKELPVSISSADVSSPNIILVPSGQVIFVSNRDGKRALYIANYDGSNQRQFVAPQNGGEDFAPTISPDNKWVMFSSTRDQVKTPYGDMLSKLYIVSRDGLTLKKVGEEVGHSSVIWSPDGRYIYYTAYVDAAQTKLVQRFYDVSKSSVFDLGDTSVNSMTFNSTGTTVAYAISVINSTSDYTNTLKTLTLATGERKNLMAKVGPAFTNISFLTGDAAIAYEIYGVGNSHRYNVNIASATETEVPLVKNPDTRVYKTAPNGKLKAFLENRDGKEDLFVVNADGSNEKRLTTLGVANAKIPLVWDESGKYITFGLKREGENALYIGALDGGNPKKVVDFSDDQNYPAYY
jgi:Tol biopolymer transport system component